MTVDQIHKCGEAMEKHKPLNDPYCFQLGFKAAVEIMQGEDTEKWERFANREYKALEKYQKESIKNLKLRNEITQLKQTQEMLVGALKDCEDAAINYDLELEGWQIREITDKALAALKEKK